MSDRADHCPFLNRADSRCAAHFCLDRLNHAFKYCFDRYTACPVYTQLLMERRIRLVADGVIRRPLTPAGMEDARESFTQLRVLATKAAA